MKILAAKRRTALDLLRASVHSAPQSLERTAQIFNNIDDRAILKAVEQVFFFFNSRLEMHNCEGSL